MWVKVDDGFPQHPKVLAAAGRLGSAGVERVLSVWLQVMCYSNRHLTDGFISDHAATDLRGTKPRDVLKILALPSVRLLARTRGGWTVHDYHEYQPTKSEIEKKRRKERDRKRGRRKDSARSPRRVRAESVRTADGIRAASADPSPIRSDPARPQEKDQDQEQRADARASHKVLVKLAHDVLDTISPDAETPALSELGELLKLASARASIPYTSRAAAKAMDSALAQRQQLNGQAVHPPTAKQRSEYFRVHGRKMPEPA